MIHPHAAHVGLALLEVQAFDMILLAFVNVDGLGVDRGKRAREINLADHLGHFGFIDDDEIVGCYGTQADGVGRIRLIGPVPEFTAAVKKTGFEPDARREATDPCRRKVSPAASGSSNAAAFR